MTTHDPDTKHEIELHYVADPVDQPAIGTKRFENLTQGQLDYIRWSWSGWIHEIERELAEGEITSSTEIEKGEQNPTP